MGLHWESSQNGWIARDIFTDSDHTKCSIVYIKHFLWPILQSGMRAIQQAQIFKIGYEFVGLYWDLFQNSWILKDIFTANERTACNVSKYRPVIDHIIIGGKVKIKSCVFSFLGVRLSATFIDLINFISFAPAIILLQQVFFSIKWLPSRRPFVCKKEEVARYFILTCGAILFARAFSTTFLCAKS